MSLSKISLSQLIKKQYKLKLKSYYGFFSSLVVLQLVALLFSLNGIGQGSRSGLDVAINVHYYTPDYIVVFTMIWAFVISYQLIAKENREQDFIFVTNRFTSHAANTLFLLTMSLISSVLAMLAVFPLQIIVHSVLKIEHIFGTGLSSSVSEFIMGLIAMILFIFLISILGYLAGILVQRSKLFIALLPALVIGFLFVSFKMEQAGQFNPLVAIFTFYFQESTFWLFLLKMIVTACVLLAGSMRLLHRLEVR